MDKASSHNIHNPIFKPWGFEYEFLDESGVSAWILQLGIAHKSGYVNGSSRTSMHMHSSKLTTVVCLDGIVDIVLVTDSVRLSPGMSISILPTKFHRLQSYLGHAVVLEVESPSQRNDIFRIKDDHGRINDGYMWDVNTTISASLYGHQLTDGNLSIQNKAFISRTTINLSSLKSYSEETIFIPLQSLHVEGTSAPLLNAGCTYNRQELIEAFRLAPSTSDGLQVISSEWPSLVGK